MYDENTDCPIDAEYADDYCTWRGEDGTCNLVGEQCEDEDGNIISDCECPEYAGYTDEDGVFHLD